MDEKGATPQIPAEPLASVPSRTAVAGTEAGMTEEESGHHHHHHPHRHHHHHQPTVAVTGDDEEEKTRHHHHHHRFLTRLQRTLSTFFHRLAQVPFAIVLFLLGLMPILYYGGEAWWLPTALAVLIVAYGLWILSAWWCGGEHKRVRHSNIIWVILLPFLIGLCQLVPMKGVVHLLNPVTWQCWHDFEQFYQVLEGDGAEKIRYTLSLAPDGTMGNCLLLLICILIFVLLMSKAHHRLHLKLIMLTVILAAVGNAVIAYASFIFDKSGMAQLQVFRGPFLNRNHFGFMMMMGSMACAGLLAGINSSSTRDKQDWQKWRMLTVPLALVMFMLLVALVLTLSRGAFIATGVSLLCLGLIWLKKGHEIKRNERQKVMSLMLLVAIALVATLPYAMTTLMERYEHLAEEREFTLESRLLVWKDSLKMIRDNWVVGVGLGAYGDTIQRYESGRIVTELIGHAHNDFLELTAEIGVPAMLVLMAIFVTAWYQCLRRCWRQRDRTYRWTGLGALMALVGAVIHENFDFSLQAWSNAILMTALLAVAAISGRDRSVEAKPSRTEESRLQNRKERYSTRLFWLPASLLLMACLLPFQYRKIRAAIAFQQLADEMVEADSGWQPGVGDYQRRLRYAKVAMAGFGRTQSLMKMTSAVFAELAVRSTGMHQRETRKEYWRSACDDIVQACRRSPQDGECALMCARVFEQANLAGTRQDDDRFLVSLYERAIACQPTIRQVTAEAAFALARFYRRSLTLAPDESESFRSQSLAMLCRLLELQPKGSRRIFAVLSSLVDDPDELLGLVPNNYDARSTMMEYLEDRRQYGLAAHLGELMQDQLPQASHLDTEKEAMQRQAYLLGHRMMQLELLGRSDERNALWEKSLDIARSLNLSNDWSPDVTKDNEALSRFRNAARISRRIFPLNEENILHEAQMHEFLTHPDDVVSALLPLTYDPDRKGLVEILQQARDLLAGTATHIGVDAGDDDGYALIRLRYVQSAVNVLLAVPANDEQLLEAARKELSRLEVQQSRAGEGRRWLQRHMISFYLGWACEALGDVQGAVTAYRHCLENCPRNYWAMRHLNGLDPSALTASEASLLAILSARQTPVALFTNGLLWCALTMEPPVMAQQHERLKATFHLMVTGEMSRAPILNFQFYDARGFAFRHRVLFQEDEALTWKVGQMLAVTAKLQPSISTLSTRQRVLRSGKVFVRATEAAVPIPVTPAFEVKND